jgi:hypothetical protein
MARSEGGGSSSGDRGSGSESRKRPAMLQARFTAEEAAGIRAKADRPPRDGPSTA